MDPIADTLVTAALNTAGGEAGKEGITKTVGAFGEAKSRIQDMTASKAIANRSAFGDYLQRACAKYSRIKTMLYRQPKSIESFFEPTSIRVSDGSLNHNEDIIVSAANVEDVIKLGSRLIIAGAAGTGKSIIMRHLFIDACRSKSMIPIYVKLRDASQSSDGPSVINLAFQSLEDNGFEYGKKTFEQYLDTAGYLFLLDGLDEVPDSDVGNLRKSIVELGDRHPSVKIIVTSRMVEDDFRSWQNYVVAETMALSKPQSLSLVERLKYDHDVTERFIEELDNRLYDLHTSFASNPLLLTLMFVVYSHKPFIPDDMTEFYSYAFDTLLREHDATKEGQLFRPLKCGLPDESFRRVFEHFCFTTYLRGQYTFDKGEALERIDKALGRICSNVGIEVSNEEYLHDLTESVCMLQRENHLGQHRYVFAHHSFQEFFAAKYTVELDEDTKLRRVVMRWLEDHSLSGLQTSVYFSSLMHLNPKRYIRHVLYCQLSELCDKCQYSDEPYHIFINKIYSGVSVVDDGETRTLEPRIKNGPLYELKRQLLSYYAETKAPEPADRHAVPEEKKACQARLLQYMHDSESTYATIIELDDAGLLDALMGFLGYSEADSLFAIVGLLRDEYSTTSHRSVYDDIDEL